MTKESPINNFLCSYFPKPFLWCFFLYISVWRMTSGSIWSGFQIYYSWIINSGSITSTYSCKIMTVLIHEVRSQINYTQRLCSISWQPEDAGLVQKFRSRRQIETCKLWVHKISFTMQNRKNTGTGFCWLSLTFVLHKI